MPRSFSFFCQLLQQPAIITAVGIHGLILALPIAQTATEHHSLPQASPQPKVRSISLTELVAPKKLVSGEFKHLPRPSPQIASIPALREPIMPAVKPSPSPLLETVVPSPAVASPTPVALATPLPTPSPSPLGIESSANQQINSLFSAIDESGEKSLESQLSPSLFTDPSLFFDPNSLQADQTPKLREGILRTAHISDKSTIQVYVDILVNQGQSNNFQVVEKGMYASGTIYEVKQEQETWYFNLVSTKDGTGTIVVVWQQDPSSAVQ